MSLSIFVQTGLIKQEESWFSFNCVIETFKKEKRKEKERKKMNEKHRFGNSSALMSLCNYTLCNLTF